MSGVVDGKQQQLSSISLEENGKDQEPKAVPELEVNSSKQPLNKANDNTGLKDKRWANFFYFEILGFCTIHFFKHCNQVHYNK